MTILEALDKAVAAGIADGSIDEVKHMPTIEAARKVAEVMDGAEWPMVNEKLDNVSPSVFLKYCTTLKLYPDSPVPEKEKKGEVISLTGKSKWKKASNG